MFGRPKVDFLIIGAQKCGTSSFYRYLTANLRASGARQKELHYFDLFHDKGTGWYYNNFDFKRGLKYGECTPFYLMHPAAAERAYRYNPMLKLIAILRNPVERAWSHYLMNREAGRETLEFEKALDLEQERINSTNNFEDPNSEFLHFSYAARGCYAKQLDHWTQYFPKKQLHLVEYKQFFLNPWQEIQPVYRFLELAPLYDTLAYHENITSAKDTIPTSAANRLNDYFREPNRELATKYGIRFE